MPWPTETDFNEAVQSPPLAFADLELQGGQPELTKLGLPRPYSGAFATVYKLQCGSRAWALRCFNREFPDQQARYVAISDALSRAGLPYTVRFEFLTRGIRVRGNWFPVLKMEWVQGEGLALYIERHLKEPAVLIDLANRWLRMAADLREAKIAHGDLQHGNVLVASGELKLIDYDGMWVPALAGREAHELGQKNYQHPRRDMTDFGPHIDNFSTWVIYLSLLALSAQPELWQRFQGGDECLLLRRADFEKPDSSAVLSILTGSFNGRTNQLACAFLALLPLAPSAIPPLGATTAGLPTRDGLIVACCGCGKQLRLPVRTDVRRVRCPICGWEKSGGLPSSHLPDWVRDHLTSHDPLSGASVAQPIDKVAGGSSDLTWIFDALDPVITAVAFTGKPWQERVVAIVCGVICAATVIGWAAGIVPAVLVAGGMAASAFSSMFFAWAQYRGLPSVTTRRQVYARLSEAELQIVQFRSQASKAERMAERLRQQLAQETGAAQREKHSIDQAAVTEGNRIRLDASRQQTEIGRKRQAALDQEAAALSRVQLELRGKIAVLDNKIAEQSRRQSSELDAALNILRRDFISAHLKRYRLQNHDIPGIGPTLTDRLFHAGVITADDVSHHSVQRASGIGSTKAAALLRWRSNLETRANPPTSLPQVEIARIRSRSDSVLTGLEIESAKLRAQLQKETSSIQAVRVGLVSAQDAAERILKTITSGLVSKVQAEANSQRDVITRKLADSQTRIEDQVRKIEAAIAVARGKICDLEWQKAKFNRQLRAYESLSFGCYLRHIFGAAK